MLRIRRAKALAGLAVVELLLSCSSERAVNPKGSSEYRLYAYAHGDSPSLYYYAVDDTSHRLIDSVMGLNTLWQLEVSPDGRWLYAGRWGTGTEIIKIDVVTKEIIATILGVGLFVLSENGDTLISGSGGLKIISTSTMTVLNEPPVRITEPFRCGQRPWVTGEADSGQIVIYDYSRDSIVAFGACRDLAGRARSVSHVSIDPEGKRLWVNSFNAVIVIDVQSWTTLAEIPVHSGVGEVAFGYRGYPVFVPDPVNREFLAGLLYVVSPTDFTILDTIHTQGPVCFPGLELIGRIRRAAGFQTIYGVSNIGLYPSHLLGLDSETGRKLEWITYPGDCMRRFNSATLGPLPPADE